LIGQNFFFKKELEIRKDFILLLIINILNNIKNILTGFKPFPLQKCPRGFLPRPLLRAGFSPRRISKTLAEVLQNPFPRKLFLPTPRLFPRASLSLLLERLGAWRASLFSLGKPVCTPRRA